MKRATWRIVGEYRGYKLIAYYLDGIKQCTFVGIFDGWYEFRLRYHTKEIGGVVPKTRVIYLADIEKKK